MPGNQVAKIAKFTTTTSFIIVFCSCLSGCTRDTVYILGNSHPGVTYEHSETRKNTEAEGSLSLCP